MRRTLLTALVLLLFLPLLQAASKGRSPSKARGKSVRVTHRAKGGTAAKKPAKPRRQRKARIARSLTARQEFMRANPCPATGKTAGSCPGYVVDHVVPLKRGGADAASNMQWQTTAQAKAKDRVE